MIFSRTLLLLAVLLSLAGCSTPHKHFSPIAVSDQHAVVYIYRPENFSNILINPTLLLDQQPQFNLQSGEYRYLQLAPGTYQLALSLPDRFSGNHSLSLELQAGRDYFLRIDTQLKFEKNKAYSRRFDLQTVGHSRAVNEIASTQYAGEELPSSSPQQEKDTAAAPAAETQQFSISKTQNPFSK